MQRLEQNPASNTIIPFAAPLSFEGDLARHEQLGVLRICRELFSPWFTKQCKVVALNKDQTLLCQVQQDERGYIEELLKTSLWVASFFSLALIAKRMMPQGGTSLALPRFFEAMPLKSALHLSTVCLLTSTLGSVIHGIYNPAFVGRTAFPEALSHPAKKGGVDLLEKTTGDRTSESKDHGREMTESEQSALLKIQRQARAYNARQYFKEHRSELERAKIARGEFTTLGGEVFFDPSSIDHVEAWSGREPGQRTWISRKKVVSERGEESELLILKDFAQRVLGKAEVDLEEANLIIKQLKVDPGHPLQSNQSAKNVEQIALKLVQGAAIYGLKRGIEKASESKNPVISFIGKAGYAAESVLSQLQQEEGEKRQSHDSVELLLEQIANNKQLHRKSQQVLHLGVKSLKKLGQKLFR